VGELNQEMDSWVGDLPDCVRLAVNNPDRDSVFLLSMLSHMTLFAATINLREFIAVLLWPGIANTYELVHTQIDRSYRNMSMRTKT
jgi:hypothetical protein